MVAFVSRFSLIWPRGLVCGDAIVAGAADYVSPHNCVVSVPLANAVQLSGAWHPAAAGGCARPRVPPHVFASDKGPLPASQLLISLLSVTSPQVCAPLASA